MIRKLSMFIASVLALGLTACEPQRAPTQAPPASSGSDLTLRTYDVPPGHGPKLRPILANLLKRGDEPIGRTALAPDGRLVVLAPASIHEGVAAFLKDAKKDDGAIKPPPTIALSYWLVVAAPGSSPDAQRCGPKGLKCLRAGPDLIKAVEAVDATHGPDAGKMHYDLLEHLSVRSMDSEHANLHGAAAHIHQRAAVVGDKIIADLEVKVMRPQAPGVETRLQFSPEQTVILGQVAFREDPKGEKSDKDTKGMLLFITRGKIEE